MSELSTVNFDHEQHKAELREAGISPLELPIGLSSLVVGGGALIIDALIEGEQAVLNGVGAAGLCIGAIIVARRAMYVMADASAAMERDRR